MAFLFDHPVGSLARRSCTSTTKAEISRKDKAGIFQVKDGDHWYIYSQFEEISARRAFPCFDEPAYKVPWQVTLNVPSNDGAFSNTPVLSEGPGSGGMKSSEVCGNQATPKLSGRNCGWPHGHR